MNNDTFAFACKAMVGLSAFVLTLITCLGLSGNLCKAGPKYATGEQVYCQFLKDTVLVLSVQSFGSGPVTYNILRKTCGTGLQEIELPEQQLLPLAKNDTTAVP